MKKYIEPLLVVLIVAFIATVLVLTWANKYKEVYEQEFAATGPCSCSSESGYTLAILSDGSEITVTPSEGHILVDEKGNRHGATEDCAKQRAAYAAWGSIFNAIVVPPPGLPINPSGLIFGAIIGTAFGRTWPRNEYELD